MYIHFSICVYQYYVVLHMYLSAGSCRPECSLLSSTKGTCTCTSLLPLYMSAYTVLHYTIWNKGSDVSSVLEVMTYMYMYVCIIILCMYTYNIIHVVYVHILNYLFGQEVTLYYNNYFFSQRGDSSAAVLQVKRHILQVTTHQMAILLLFNKKTSITFQVNLIVASSTSTCFLLASALPIVRLYPISLLVHLRYFR